MLNDVSDYTEVKTEKARNCIMENISRTPIDIDELLNWCHVSAQEISAAILELELAGLIQRHYGNRITNIKRLKTFIKYIISDEQDESCCCRIPR